MALATIVSKWKLIDVDGGTYGMETPAGVIVRCMITGNAIGMVLVPNCILKQDTRKNSAEAITYSIVKQDYNPDEVDAGEDFDDFLDDLDKIWKA